MTLSLDATSLHVAMPRLGRGRRHPNRLPFRGVLTLVDTPSDRPPSGANNHRVLIPRAIAEAALPSLIGMAIDYTPTLDGHDSRRKIGVITAAAIAPSSVVGLRSSAKPSSVETGLAPSPVEAPPRVEAPDFRPVNSATIATLGFSPGAIARGAALEIRGHIFARDFPEVVLELLRATAPATFQTSSQRFFKTEPSRGAATACSPPLQRWDAMPNTSPGGATAAPPTINAAADHHRPGLIRAHIDTPIFGQRPNTEDRRPLGMSYEIAEAQVVNMSATIWVLQDFVFTGAAVLRRDHAAYRNTSIELMS